MKKPIPHVSTIHCDLCSHEFKGVPAHWHHLKCPKCGQGEVITDKDMVVVKGLEALELLGLAQFEPKGKKRKGWVDVQINTACLNKPNQQ